jgi:hypothetical protein
MRDLGIARLFSIGVFLLSLVAPAAAGNRRLLHASSASSTPWTAADLDGDRKLDLARPGAFRAEPGGFLQELHFRFASTQRSVITVHLSSVAHRVTFRDLDGDSDRDLVLEGMDSNPIAVLLNDGGGQFHLANLEDFRAELPQPERRSIEDSKHSSVTEDGCAPSAAALPPLSVRSREAHRLPRIAVRPAPLRACACITVTRGPPSLS